MTHDPTRPARRNAPRPISEREPFDPRYDLTAWEAAHASDAASVTRPSLDTVWLRPDGSTVSERELLEAEGGIGGPA
jgi:hypothetical protein